MKTCVIVLGMAALAFPLGAAAMLPESAASTTVSAAFEAGQAAAASAAKVAVRAASAPSPSAPSPDIRLQLARPLRLIADQGSNGRWLLLSDPLHPGGPGRLVHTSARDTTGAGPSGRALQLAPPKAMIRAGDRLLVEEHTAIADVVLQAVALAPGAAGAALPAKLTPGGNLIRVIATAPGRAQLALPTEAQRTEAQP